MVAMLLKPIDWGIIAAFFVISLVIGLIVARRAGSSMREYFIAGGRMPWWLLGVSMVATTFSTDTPNLVSDIVRTHGVSGNWMWWSFLLTGMLTVFVYAKLWRRSGIMTDVEFYELRYSGKSAAFLRGFRAIYLGLIFNVIIMGSVSLAAIKIGAILLGITPVQTVLIAGCATVIYSSLGGLQGVLLTDFLQFSLAMIGSVAAAVIALRHPDVGGLAGLLSNETLQTKLSLIPDPADHSVFITLLVIPLLVSWWSVWYPGSEPGGGGYIVQRMLAAKDENNSLGAVFLFNAAHYALRPWPWIIVALCSMVVFPNIDALKAAFPDAEGVVGNDLGYPAMLTFLPSGILGMMVAALAAAYMSTISTHLNWGASYLVHDVYERFLRPDATDREYVWVGRVVTLVLMVLMAVVALRLESALDSFQIILQIGAGTGLLFILRWFWWRINAFSEITAMVVSFIVAVFFRLIGPNGNNIIGSKLAAFLVAVGTAIGEMNEGFKARLVSFADVVGIQIVDGNSIVIAPSTQLILGVTITTVAWILVTLLTSPTKKETLIKFYQKVYPGGPGWRPVVEEARAQGIEGLSLAWQMPTALACIALGVTAIYSTLFATGYWLYGRTAAASIMTALACLATFLLVLTWRRLTTDPAGNR